MADRFIYKGNINLYNRPTVMNGDGSISTVRSISYNRNGKEVLIPTVSNEGKIMNDEEAIRYWENKGQNLGVYDSIEEADRAARQIHYQQESLYNRGGIMANEQFDLGEALGGYEQAKADRNFYLNMIDMGQNNRGAFMASPIAAYLYGVSNVKMANMRAKAQNIEDQRQAEKDALAATEKAQKRADNIDNQIITLVKGARDGSIPASVAAIMLGPLLKEKGISPEQFIPEKSLLIGREPGDEKPFEWDLSEKENSLEAGRNKRAEDRIAWEKEKQDRAIQGQKEVVKYKKEVGSGSGASQEKPTTLSNFRTTHKPVLDAIGRDFRMNRLTKAQVQDFIEGAESLSPQDKKQVQSKVDEVMDWVAKNKKEWSFSSPAKQTQTFDLNAIWQQ